MTKARPTGVVVVSAFLVVSAAYYFCLWIQFSASAYHIWKSNAERAQQAGIEPLRFYLDGQPLQHWIEILGMVAGVTVPFAIAALLLTLAIYLLKLADWARVVTCALLSAGAFYQLQQLFFVKYGFGQALVVSGLIMSVDLGIVWYLLRPRTKAAFNSPTSTPIK